MYPPRVSPIIVPSGSSPPRGLRITTLSPTANSVFPSNVGCSSVIMTGCCSRRPFLRLDTRNSSGGPRFDGWLTAVVILAMLSSSCRSDCSINHSLVTASVSSSTGV